MRALKFSLFFFVSFVLFFGALLWAHSEASAARKGGGRSITRSETRPERPALPRNRSQYDYQNQREKIARNGGPIVQGSVKDLYIAFVIDTTISMGPLVQETVRSIQEIRDDFVKRGYGDRIFFAAVAFRSNHLTSPGLEYTTRIASDFQKGSNRQAFSRSMSMVRVARRSSHSFNEDSLAGLEEAIYGLSWPTDPQDARILILITDAGPLPPGDPHRSTDHSPMSLANLARSKNILVIPVHLKTRAGRKNHQWAEQAYRNLTRPSNDLAYADIVAPSMSQSANYLRGFLFSLVTGFQSFLSPIMAKENLSPGATPSPGPTTGLGPTPSPGTGLGPGPTPSPGTGHGQGSTPVFIPKPDPRAIPRFEPRPEPRPEAGLGPQPGQSGAADSRPVYKPEEPIEDPEVAVAGLGRAAEGARSSLPRQDDIYGPPGVAPSREAVKALLGADPPADTQRLESALAMLENTPGSNDDVFLLIRVLSKRDPKYRLRLAEIFDPTYWGNKLEVRPNLKFAYDEYMACGLPEAQFRVDRLIEWSKSEEAKSVDGYKEFLEAIK